MQHEDIVVRNSKEPLYKFVSAVLLASVWEKIISLRQTINMSIENFRRNF